MLRKLLVLLLIAANLLGACSRPTPTSTPLPPSPARPTSPPAPTPIPTPYTVQVDAATDLDNFFPSSAFTLHFNQPMDPGSTPTPLLTYPWVEGEFSWDASFTRLSFSPAGGFTPRESYFVFLNQGLKSAAGAGVSGDLPEWQVEVQPAPRVTERQPAQARLTERRPLIQLSFDRPMDQASVNAGLSVLPAIPFTPTWEGQTVTLTLGEPLAPGTRYRFSLAASAADSQGIPLGQDYYWEYTLDPLLAQVIGPDRTRRDRLFDVQFNYPVVERSLASAAVIEPAIAGTWILNGRQAVFQPAGELPFSTRYQLHFTASLQDVNGDPFPAGNPVTVTTPPPILDFQPLSGGEMIQQEGLWIQFATAVDPARTAAAFSLDPPVEGQIEWDGDRLIFRPDEPWVLGREYTATLQTGAAAADGSPLLLEPFTWSFRTPYAFNSDRFEASFGDEGPNAQVLDASGRRAIQFIANGRSQQVSAELYQLNLEQFLDRYSSGFRGVTGFENGAISTTDAPLVATWPVDVSGQGAGYSESIYELTIPVQVAPGLYILNLVAGGRADQLILILTNNTLMVKRGGQQIFAWVSDINGGSRADIEIGVYARNGQLLSQGRSDSNGVYTAQITAPEGEEAPDLQPLIVIARDGADITASGLSNEWQSSGAGWWSWWRPEPKPQRYAVHIHTDRPIYRPGQNVFFKAILRAEDDASLGLLPEGSQVAARVRDARGNIVQTFELTANNFGSVHGEFSLAEGAMLGDYQVEVSRDDEVHTQAFKVQDYRKPDYRVEVETPAGKYVVGDQIPVTIDAQYFFGQPVAGARLTLRSYRLGEYYSWDDSGEPPQYVWYDSYGGATEGETDANGRYQTTLSAVLDEYTDWYGSWEGIKQSTWGVEVTLDDGSHQTVSSFTVYTVYGAAETLELETGGYLKTPEQPFTVQGSVATLDGGPVPGRSLLLELRQWNRSTYDYDLIVQSLEMMTGSDGRFSLPYTISSSGYYQLRLSGQDGRGNPIRTNAWLYAIRPNDTWASAWQSDLSISADRESYAPGDTARLIITSSFSGPGLLTFERGSTRRSQPVMLTSPATLVDVQILPGDAPNIYVSVNAWQEQDTHLFKDISGSLSDSKLRTASLKLPVPVTEKTLQVEIRTDRAAYAPRDRAVVTVRVTDSGGQPAPAEVSLALVDEAIFSLSADLSRPIFDSFYAERPHRVRTFNSMALLRYLFLGGRGGGGDEAAGSPRSDFPDTAAWFPALYTDANGEARVEIDLPDSLTTWRLTARTVTQDTRVGESTHTFLTQKEVVVRPVLPRTLTAGDTVTLAALVHNYTSGLLDLNVSLTTAGGSGAAAPLAPLGETSKPVQIDPGGHTIVFWEAQAEKAGQAEVTISATPTTAGPGDAVRLPLPIRPLAVPDVTTQLGSFSGDFETVLLVPTDILDLSTMRIELSRSVAGTLLTGLEYLTGYPYGCVEQTMSRALPNAVVGRAFKELGVENLTLVVDLPPLVRAGLQRLYGYQHNDGGWGWWFDDATDAYQTAWVVFGLAVAAEAGYEVDPQVIERGAQWLQRNLKEMDMRTQAYALYSLAVAGYGDLEGSRRLADQVRELDAFSQAGLALALHTLGASDEANRILDLLAESAVTTGGQVYWPTAHEDGHYHDKTMSSSTRSTALVLDAFVRIRPGHALEPGIVAWLMAHRRDSGWGSTNETSYAILALTDHILSLPATTGATSYAIELNGQQVAQGELGLADPAASLTIPAGQLAPGGNHLRIRQNGTGRLYYLIQGRMYFASPAIAAAGDVLVSRTYTDPATGQPVESVAAGQLVRVSLTVRLPATAFFVILEDQLPGGLEALNESLNTTSHEAVAYGEEPRYFWQEYGYNNKEVRGDRVSFFITELPAGERTFSYLARATQSGRFTALPAEVYAMYDSSVWGRSASSILVVK